MEDRKKILFIKATKILNENNYENIIGLTDLLNNTDYIDKTFIESLLTNLKIKSEGLYYFVSNIKYITEQNRINLMWEFIIFETLGHPEKLDDTINKLLNLIESGSTISDSLFYQLINTCNLYKRYDLIDTIESILMSK